MHLTLIAGARPNFIKIAPIIKALEQYASSEITYQLVHTGQHYDEKMSRSFFEELQIPQPDINLEVGSGSQAEQTAAIMQRFEEFLLSHPSDLVLVVGDVTSTMACAIVAKKLHTAVAHVEGGIRSGDMTMPEEINRIVTDAISDYFFTTTKEANENLRKEGKQESQLFLVGNTMIDTLLAKQSELRPPTVFEANKLRAGEYLVLTLHRPSNVDEEENLAELLSEIVKQSRGIPIIFPVHPRTAKMLEKVNARAENLIFCEPLPYLEFNYLVKHAKAVITDSGGITEETTVMGIPCMTLRSSTERPETVTMGTNELLGINPQALAPAMDKLFSGNWKKGAIPPLWDGSTSKRIVQILKALSQD